MPVRSDPRLHALERPSRRCRAGRRQLALIALDSDGTVFDSIAMKRERCLLPAFQASFARDLSLPLIAEIWDAAALGFRLGGGGRLRSLAAAIRLLLRHPEAKPAGAYWRWSVEALEAWLNLEGRPSSGSLEAFVDVDMHRNPGTNSLGYRLLPALGWLSRVRKSMASLAPLEAFPAARAALPVLARKAELLVLAPVPGEELRSDWGRARLGRRVAAYLGDESGDPRGALPAYAAFAAEEGRFASEKLLVVSASPWAPEAARSSGAAFFPIIPGREDECWTVLATTGFERFLSGEAAPGGALLADFLASTRRPSPWRSRCS